MQLSVRFASVQDVEIIWEALQPFGISQRLVDGGFCYQSDIPFTLDMFKRWYPGHMKVRVGSGDAIPLLIEEDKKPVGFMSVGKVSPTVPTTPDVWKGFAQSDRARPNSWAITGNMSQGAFTDAYKAVAYHLALFEPHLIPPEVLGPNSQPRFGAASRMLARFCNRDFDHLQDFHALGFTPLAMYRVQGEKNYKPTGECRHMFIYERPLMTP